MITIFLYACINPYNSVLHENPCKHIGVVLKPSTTVIVIGNVWSVAVLETKQILWDLQRCCYVNNLFSPS